MTLTEWQERIDADFPHGLVMYYGEPELAVPVATVTVVGVQSGYPSVYFWSLDGVKFYSDLLLSYRVVQAEPVRLVSVRAVDSGEWQWSSNIGGELRELAESKRDGERKWALELNGVEA